MTEETGTLGYVAPKVTKEHNPYVKDWLGLTFYLPHCECSIDTCYLGTKLVYGFVGLIEKLKRKRLSREDQELMQKLPDSSKSNADSFGKKLMDRIRPTQPRFLHSTLRPPLPRCLNPTPVPAMLMQIHSDTIAKEEFENLCLILGIELDAVTTEKAIIRKEKHIEEEEADDDEEVIYK
ncbi:hypothetical protein YC2023_009646 [Brassica napus]